MSTVAPSKVREFAATSIENIAYSSVTGVPTREPNDQYRLGYTVYRVLTDKNGTIADAVKQSGARILISEQEAVRLITDALKSQNVDLP